MPLDILRIVIILIILVFIIGILGFHYFFDQEWIDSFYYTSVTMSSLSLEIKPENNSQKIFVSLFSLLSIGMYLILIAVLVSLFFQRNPEYHSKIH